VSTATTILAVLGLVVIAAAVVVADRLGQSLVKPVNSLAATARRLGEGDLEAVAIIEGPEEVAEVGTALNTLAGRLGDMITSERESLADLSHRLRTPLTGLRLQAERLTNEDDRLALLAAIDRMQQAVDGLIRDVREGSRQSRQSDAAAVVSRRVQFWTLLANEQQRTVTAVLDAGPLPVAAAADELGSLLDGLIGNIFAHTPMAVAFEVRLQRQDRQAVLVVGDAGPGFRPGFDPLKRGASGGGSTGLGLDIARRVAEQSGGRVALSRSRLGGAEVRVELPLFTESEA
jgi:signal transduction histidine kinase